MSLLFGVVCVVCSSAEGLCLFCVIRWLLRRGCWLLFFLFDAVCCAVLFVVVCCLLFVVLFCCFLCGLCCVACASVAVICRLLIIVCCLLRANGCLLLFVCRVLCDLRCLLFGGVLLYV